MIINSDFHDYYDPIARYGVDKTVVYNRKTADLCDHVPITEYFSGELLHRRLPADYYGCILFCGRYLPLIWTTTPVRFCYTKEAYLDATQTKEYIAKQGSFYSYNKSIPEFFEVVKPNQNKNWTEVHRKYKSPIIYIYRSSHDHIVVNPQLSKLRFQTIVDPFTAFQDIQNYISGVLGTPMNEPSTISDIIKIAKHGFNKFSFRKQPKEK